MGRRMGCSKHGFHTLLTGHCDGFRLVSQDAYDIIDAAGTGFVVMLHHLHDPRGWLSLQRQIIESGGLRVHGNVLEWGVLVLPHRDACGRPSEMVDQR